MSGLGGCSVATQLIAECYLACLYGAAFYSVLFGRGALIFVLPLQLLKCVVLPLSRQTAFIPTAVFMSQWKTGSSKNWCHEILGRALWCHLSHL